MALCRAGPLVEDLKSAERLVTQITPYLLEAHAQAILPSPFLRSVEPSPWEALSYNLVAAMLAVGTTHTALHSAIFSSTIKYLHNCEHAIQALAGTQHQKGGIQSGFNGDETLEVARLAISILGFLESASAYLDFYEAEERLELIETLRRAFSEGFLTLVEGAFSLIRNSESTLQEFSEWRQYTKQYANSGRPLGAMLLQQGFMRLLVSCSSLQNATIEELKQKDILDILMSRRRGQRTSDNSTVSSLIATISDIATQEMELLDDGADYLELGSAWQQRLAFSAKAYALTAFLNCMLVDEEIADADVLITWLEDTLADPVEMANDDLACVVLKSMAVVATISPSIASTLSRSLPRYIVQGGIQGSTVAVAARSLAFILKLVSTDAVITCMYSLGNILSAGSSAEKGIKPSASANGSLNGPQNAAGYARQSTGSAISLDLRGDEDVSIVHGNVVRTIVGIAAACKDEKITALAQSMLVQKLGRVNLGVDLRIIAETATLATSGGQVEFKSLLKLYTRFSHDGVVQKNDTLLEAVSTLSFVD